MVTKLKTEITYPRCLRVYYPEGKYKMPFFYSMALDIVSMEKIQPFSRTRIGISHLTKDTKNGERD